MGDVIDISKIIEENNFEILLEHFVNSYPEGNRRVITELVMGIYKTYKDTHSYQAIKKILEEKIPYQLSIHRECILTENNVIPFKKD